MSALEIWQRPAADDINPDALEYLFDGSRRKVVEVPWVRGAREPEPVNKNSPEYVRLQTKVDVLLGQIDLLTSQLHAANCELGYAKALIDDRDRQLDSLSEYRARAAKAILGDVQNELLRKRVDELENQLIAAGIDKNLGDEMALERLKAPASLSGIDSQMRSRSTPTPYVPLMPAIYLLALALAAVMMFTIFY